MDFLKTIPSLKDTPSGDKAADDKSSPDLMGSAKQVAEAAQLAANKQYEKIDKAHVAGAGADLLEGAQDFAKLGTDGVGEYVVQAHDYLESYSKSSTTATPEATKDPKPEASKEEEKHVPAALEPETWKGENSPGDYMVMPQGFLGKSKEEEKSEEKSVPDAIKPETWKGDNSPGGYMVMPQGFLGNNSK